MKDETFLIVFGYIFPLIITLCYFLFHGDEDVKDLRRLLLSGYIFTWLIPFINILGAFLTIIVVTDELISGITINIKTPKIIQRILDFKIPIRKTK